MRIIQISKHDFKRHPDNPKRFYIKNLSHRGIIYWLGLWFFELRISANYKPN